MAKMPPRGLFCTGLMTFASPAAASYVLHCNVTNADNGMANVCCTNLAGREVARFSLSKESSIQDLKAEIASKANVCFSSIALCTQDGRLLGDEYAGDSVVQVFGS